MTTPPSRGTGGVALTEAVAGPALHLHEPQFSRRVFARWTSKGKHRRPRCQPTHPLIGGPTRKPWGWKGLSS